MTDTPTTPQPDLPPAAVRFRELLLTAGHADTVVALPDSARTAAEAAAALGTTADCIASSLVFGIRPEAETHATLTPLLVVTSGGHRVDTARVAADLGTPKLHRVDAAFVRAAAGHPHCVFRTTYPELVRLTGGRPSTVA